MCLAEFVTRRDVGKALVQVQVLEPGRLADMEMIDRMQIVVEARQRDFPRAQSAAISKPTVDQQDVEARASQITSKDQPVVSGTDNYAVIGFFERIRQSEYPVGGPRSGPATLHCRGRSAAVNGRRSVAEKPETPTLSNLP